MLQLSNLRIPGIHIGRDFRLKRIPVCNQIIASRLDVSINLLDRRSSSLMFLLPTCDNLLVRFFLSSGHCVFCILGAGRQVGELCGKWFDHGLQWRPM